MGTATTVKKGFNLQLPREIWVFLKDISKDKEVSMTSVIIDQLYCLKNKNEKKLK